jgi:hypothetical protein
MLTYYHLADPFASPYGDGQLIPMDQLSVGGELATVGDDDFDDVILSSSFLARIQLFGANSDAVKEEKIGQGRFGLVRSKDDVEDLGKNLDCLPLAWRLKAMQIVDGEVFSNFDHQSDEFKRIQAESEEQDSGCMYGVEFLLWLPELGVYVTYFLSSKSSRREAKPLRGLIGKGATIEAKLVKTKRYSWHAPKVVACSTPFSELPDPNKMKEELAKFNNPNSSDTEGATDEEAASQDTSRR